VKLKEIVAFKRNKTQLTALKLDAKRKEELETETRVRRELMVKVSFILTQKRDMLSRIGAKPATSLITTILPAINSNRTSQEKRIPTAGVPVESRLEHEKEGLSL
jgi:hypothetical protein